MARHTPPPPIALEEHFPELARHRKETLRLHPRPGEPSFADSSVGGPLRWPADQDWPLCDELHYHVDDGDTPEEDTVHDSVVPMVPVLQIYRSNAPEVPFPEGSDLLQVLWCPFNHGELYERCPLPRVFWRSTAQIGEVLIDPPVSGDAPDHHVPKPCVVHPERAVEYPDRDDIPRELLAAIEGPLRELERNTGWNYFYHLSTAPGTKLGGHPRGWNGPTRFDCGTCGQRLEHLLTVSSFEYDGESWRTWLPKEDRPEIDDGRDPHYGERSSSAHDATGLDLGDGGMIYVFECRRCPGRPIEHLFEFG